MKAVFCGKCRGELSLDTVALNQRLLGMHIGSFLCLDCLARKLGTTPEHLQKLTARFKEMGCAYFTRLMEVSSHAQTDDDL